MIIPFFKSTMLDSSVLEIPVPLYLTIPWFEAKKLGTNTRTEHCDENPLDYITNTQVLMFKTIQEEPETANRVGS